MSSSSRVIEATLGSKVASRPSRPPPVSAASNIASLGLSTGTGCSRATASIASPKAEQVNRMPRAPIVTA